MTKVFMTLRKTPFSANSWYRWREYLVLIKDAGSRPNVNYDDINILKELEAGMMN